MKNFQKNLLTTPGRVISFLIITGIFWVMLFTCGESVISGNNPDKVIEQVESVLESETIPPVPRSLNGTSVEQLHNYEQMLSEVTLSHKKRGELLGYLLLLRDININLGYIRAYRMDPYREVPLSTLFVQGFDPIEVNSIMKHSPYPVTDQEIKDTEETIEKLIQKYEIETYEQQLVNATLIRPDRVHRFYEELAGKLMVEMRIITPEYKKSIEKARESLRNFAASNIRVQFLIDTNPRSDSADKVFESNQHLYIGLAYSSEGFDGDIPVDFKITHPGGRVISSSHTIRGNVRNEYLSLVEDVLGSGYLQGRYSVRAETLPDTGDTVRVIETFNVGKLPFTIARVFVLDANRQARSSFKAGESIILAVQYKPLNDKIADGSFSWKVNNPSGQVVESLSINQTLKLRASENPVQTKFIRGVIPKNAAGGRYVYRMTVKAGNHQEISGDVVFNVTALPKED
jgi:hypothetical protein